MQCFKRERVFQQWDCMLYVDFTITYIIVDLLYLLGSYLKFNCPGYNFVPYKHITRGTKPPPYHLKLYNAKLQMPNKTGVATVYSKKCKQQLETHPVY